MATYECEQFDNLKTIETEYKTKKFYNINSTYNKNKKNEMIKFNELNIPPKKLSTTYLIILIILECTVYFYFNILRQFYQFFLVFIEQILWF